MALNSADGTLGAANSTGGLTIIDSSGTNAGVVVLNANNTYTGNTTVSSGTLNVSGTGDLYGAGNSSTATVRVGSGATLNISSTANNAIGFGSGETWIVAGTITVTGGAAETLPGTVTLNGGTLTSTTSNSPFGAYFSNGASITANGAGNIISSVDFGIQGGTA